MKTITPQQLKEMLRDGKEIALIDVRERGVFSDKHLLLACSIPLSHMELELGELVPRQGTRIVLVDKGPSDGSLLALKAAKRLAGLGYSDVAVLKDGIEGWREGGFELFSGVNVLSKAFGEFVETTYNTPRLSAEELKAKIDAGENLVILDSRPKEEYHRMNIPGGINTPGAELAYRVHDIAPEPETLVVVTCAGRTRSIIGAQSLINAGIPNPVAALKNGTMGWQLAGFDLEYGQDRHAPAPSSGGLEKGSSLTPLELNSIIDSGESVAVVDLATSLQYRDCHIPGAWWGVRSRLESGLPRIPTVGLVVLTSSDGILAHLAVKDVKAARPGVRVCVLEGGTRAWVEAGLPTSEGMEYNICDADDVWYKPYEHTDAVEQAMRDYLTWEVGLVEQIERDGDLNFRAFT